MSTTKTPSLDEPGEGAHNEGGQNEGEGGQNEGGQNEGEGAHNKVVPNEGEGAHNEGAGQNIGSQSKTGGQPSVKRKKLGVGRPKLPMRRPKTKNLIIEPDVIPTQGSQVHQQSPTPPLMTESSETSHFMLQVLGSVGYSAVYTPTPEHYCS
ncbi:hypothetical protein AG4045_000618 [Apium graveolens]|uniref:Uncharacterized protein n=1 Tax=Apium graveolens TaxID=4045 RepID=A0A6L5BAM9_APIGR|nr:hypothetical protein AG4045_000618 [Apium graveolens]